MNQILLAGGGVYSLIYDKDKKLYGYSHAFIRGGDHGWFWGKTAEEAMNNARGIK